MRNWIVVSLLLASAGLVRAAPLPSEASVYVEDMGHFDELVRAQILKQKLPLSLVTDPDAADYALRGSASGDSSTMSAGVELVEIRSGRIIWAASAGTASSDGLMGMWRWKKANSATKAAKKVVEQLRKAMRSRP